jgi:hypothetical protein
MDVKAYIESGVLELYVAEALSAPEMREVEALAESYPEIRARIKEIRDTMDLYHQSLSDSPPQGLKERILEAAAQQPDAGKPLGGTSPGKTLKIGAWSGWVVAGLAVLFSLWCMTRHQRQNEVLFDLQTENQELEQSVALQQAQLEFFQNEDTRTIPLGGTELSPESEVTVLWNQDLQRTYLAISNLPPPPPGKQYQLWSLVGNSPSDAGLVNFQPGGFQEMNPVDQATAFAITLENEGGSPSPTLSQLYVIGTL